MPPKKQKSNKKIKAALKTADISLPKMYPSKKKVPPSSSHEVTTSKEARKDQTYEERKSGWCRQRFREDWCHESQFEGWLEEVPDDPFRAWCKCCQCTLLVGRSELLKHNSTKKHKRAFIESQLGSSMINVIDGSSRGSPNPNGKMADEGLIRAELRLAAFAADHNLNVTAVEHLGLLVNKLGDRLDLIPKIQLDVNKCSSIVDKVLMTSAQNELESALRNNCFSLVVEEVEISDPGRRAFAVLARYYNANLNKIFNQLLQMFFVSDKDLAENNLWKRIDELLNKLKIPHENLTAISSDYSSPFFNSSTLSELNEFNRDLTIFRFNSRSMFTVILMAVYTLPEGLETLMLHFGNIVTGQMKHVYPTELLQDFPDITNFEARKYFHGIPPKEWLLNSNCNAVLAQCLPHLITLLEKRVAESSSVVAEALVKEATNPYTKAYFLFLSYILTHLESMNNLLTSFFANNYQLITEFLAQFKLLCQHFLAPAVIMVSDLTKVDLEDEKNFLSLKSICIGNDCQEYLKALNAKEETEQFMEQCRRILQVAAVEIKNRFSFNDTVLNLLPFVDPAVALCSDSRVAFPSLQPLTAKFPKLNFNKLDEQWIELPNYFSSSDIEELKRLPVDKMWGVICDLRKSNDILKFETLGRLAKIMLSLPIPDSGMVTLISMISEITRGLYPLQEMKLRLDLVSLRHTDLSSNLQCFQQRVTMKMRKLYMMNINKKDEFPDPKYIFESDNS